VVGIIARQSVYLEHVKPEQATADFKARWRFGIIGAMHPVVGSMLQYIGELVSSIYQTVFYRGLPYDFSRQNGPAWDYEFACMLAGDVSEERSLQRAWEALPRKVKTGFWEGANVYVMILRRPQ
jgi:hypothetical protein